MGLLDSILSLIYPGKRYGSPCTTKKGVSVKSRAEQTIAEYFERSNIRYEYERPLEAGIWIFTEKVSSPDFYLPDHDVYVEYWGLLEADDRHTRSKYERAMKYKMARYHELGIRFISLYPQNLKNLDRVFREKFRKVKGIDLPDR